MKVLYAPESVFLRIELQQKKKFFVLKNFIFLYEKLIMLEVWSLLFFLKDSCFMRKFFLIYNKRICKKFIAHL